MSVLELQSSAMSHEIRNALFLSTFYSSAQHESAPEKYTRVSQEKVFSTDALQQPPKWPIECQVLSEKIRHIDSTPEKPEPFYFSSNTEPQPKPLGEEMGAIIYDYQPKLSVDYFCRSCVGGAEELQTFDSDANTLKFESRFESGNLARVIKVTNVYYELYLRPDMYTDRYSQWYYFRIQNTKENVLYRFSIVNLNKPDSLYRYGLKPLMYSEKNAQMNEIGWMRCGKNISYYKNDMLADDNNSSYTLTFNLKFKFNNDTVYIAQCYPYTYTRLQNYLRDIDVDKFKSNICQKRLLCKSLAGNNVYVLTITAPGNDDDEITPVKKPVIVISARVHPGETQSSYMMGGIIDFITSDCSQAQELRERFIFKLIPMLNPDGVIVGNSRCCLLGQDLNRQYRTVLREAFPQIYHTKVLLRRLAEENGIFLYCDLHGHSRRNNAFIYGCENRRIPERKLSEQVFPLMMHKNAADKFSFQSCKFKIQKSKEGTGRIFVWTLGVANSYTLEVSLGGSTLASRQYTHFNTGDYEGLGRHFCESLLDYSDMSPAKERIREKILKKLMEGGSSAEEPVNIPITDYSSLSHSDSEESIEESENDKDANGKSTIRRQSSTKLLKTFSLTKQVKIERTALNLTKASVDLIRITSATPSLEVQEERLDAELEIKKRRSTFGRSRSRGIGRPLSDLQPVATPNLLSSPKRYTKLLFNDPFNPPYIQSDIKIDDATDAGGLSQTEDECDQTDSDFKNQNFLTVPENPDLLVREMSSLRISLQTRKLTPPGGAYVNKPYSPRERRSTIAEPEVDQTKKITFADRRKSLGVNIEMMKEQKLKYSKSQDDISASNTTTTTISRFFGKVTLTPPQFQNKITLPVPKFQPRRVSWTGGITPAPSTPALQKPTPSSGGKISTTNGGQTSSSSLAPSTSGTKKKSLRKVKSLGDEKKKAERKLTSQATLRETVPGNLPGALISRKEKKSTSKIKRIKSKTKIS